MGHTHGIKWTEEIIKERIIEVKTALGLGRMPTTAECKNYYQDYALPNAVSKRMGWYKLAEEMGLPIKEGETFLGKTHEQKATNILEEKGFSVLQMPFNFPYDLLVDGCIKVDVKASRLFKGKNGNFYTFNLEKPFATCDIYLLIELDQLDQIQRIMVIPSKFVIANTQISVGEGSSKYHKYTDRWDYFSLMSDFWINRVS